MSYSHQLALGCSHLLNLFDFSLQLKLRVGYHTGLLEKVIDEVEVASSFAGVPLPTDPLPDCV